MGSKRKVSGLSGSNLTKKEDESDSYHAWRRQRGSCPPWIFIHGTDRVDRGLIVLFFGLFSVATPLEEAL